MDPRSQSAPPEPPQRVPLIRIGAKVTPPLERTRPFRFPHLWHRDPDWQTDGIHAYHQCRCGARRTRWVNARMGAPIRPGWPYLTDRHGYRLDDSGWWAPPPEGWPALVMPDPAQIPARLMEPAMDAGQPPSLPQRRRQLEYADRTPDQLGPDIAAALTAMAGDGWRLVTFDGQRYIFERPRQDGPELHER